MEKRNEYSPNKYLEIFLIHILLEQVMLNNYLYLVTKKAQTKNKQAPGNKIPSFPYAICVGIVLGLLLFTAANALQKRRAVSSHSELLSSCPEHMGSVVIRLEEDKITSKKCFFGETAIC